jgi:hypothetical protein
VSALPEGPRVGQPTPTSALAVAAFICGLLGMLIVTLPFAIVLGVLALYRLRRFRQRGTGLAAAGLGLAVVWSLAMGAFIVVLATEVLVPEQTAMPATDPLEVGECVIVEPEPGVFLRQIPCTQGHDGEAFATFDLPAGEYPGDMAADDLADAGCASRLSAYSTRAATDAGLTTVLLRPTRSSWGDGDRRVTCVARSRTFSTGTIRD